MIKYTIIQIYRLIGMVSIAMTTIVGQLPLNPGLIFIICVFLFWFGGFLLGTVGNIHKKSTKGARDD